MFLLQDLSNPSVPPEILAVGLDTKISLESGHVLEENTQNCRGEFVPRLPWECHLRRKVQTLARWWFQIFLIFTPTWGNDPI